MLKTRRHHSPEFRLLRPHKFQEPFYDLDDPSVFRYQIHGPEIGQARSVAIGRSQVAVGDDIPCDVGVEYLLGFQSETLGRLRSIGDDRKQDGEHGFLELRRLFDWLSAFQIEVPGEDNGNGIKIVPLLSRRFFADDSRLYPVIGEDNNVIADVGAEFGCEVRPSGFVGIVDMLQRQMLGFGEGIIAQAPEVVYDDSLHHVIFSFLGETL